MIICDSVSSAQYQTASDIMLNNTSLSFSLSCTGTYTHCMVCAKAWISYDLTAFRGRGRNVQGVQQSHQSVPHQAGRLPRLKQPNCIFAMPNAKFVLYSNLLYKVGIIMLLYYNLCHGYTVTRILTDLSIQYYPFTRIHNTLKQQAGQLSSDILVIIRVLQFLLHTWLKSCKAFWGQMGLKKNPWSK